LNANRVLSLLGVMVLMLFGAGVAQADGTGGDGAVHMGGGGPGSPTCTQFQGVTGPDGSINGDCTVAPGTIATTIGFAVPDIFSNGGLSCTSDLTKIGWTASTTTLTINGVKVDECSFTAPDEISKDARKFALSHDPGSPHSHRINDGDCDLDDFLLGIPGAGVSGNGKKGCDITFNTNANGTQLFDGNRPFDVAPGNGVGDFKVFVVPEPGSLSFLLMGLTGLPFLRRKAAR
jgi:hypothetical protein